MAAPESMLGSAKCSISRLKPQPIERNSRQLDSQNVQRLVDVYGLVGCDRLPQENHVPVIVNKEVWEAIQRRNLDDGDGLCMLQPEDDLTYLRGRHRLEAAKIFLHPDERWWVVDVYNDATSSSLRQRLEQAHPNAKQFKDGDIYRNLRQASKENDQAQKQRWLAMLSCSWTKQRDLQQMEKRAAKDPQTRHLQDCLDALLPFTGLWFALQIGTFHRLLSLRCPEELSRYLTWVRDVWDEILGHNDDFRRKLDARTVSILQGRYPRSFEADQQYVEQEQQYIMPCLAPRERATILERISKVKSPIPSIHTFLEDTKFLEPGARIMKSLLPSICKTSIAQEFMTLHNSSRRWLKQENENEAVPQQEDSGELAGRRGYRQLWLFALRHFPDMLGQSLRKDKAMLKNPTPCIEQVWRFKMIQLARDCGFVGIPQPDPDLRTSSLRMVTEFVPHLIPPLMFTYGLKEKRSVANNVMNCFSNAPLATNKASMLQYICEPGIEHRCGVPHDKSFRLDQQYLHLHYIDDTTIAHQRQPFASSFVVKQYFFWGFFGRASESGQTATIAPAAIVPSILPAQMDFELEETETSPAQIDINHVQTNADHNDHARIGNAATGEPSGSSVSASTQPAKDWPLREAYHRATIATSQDKRPTHVVLPRNENKKDYLFYFLPVPKDEIAKINILTTTAEPRVSLYYKKANNRCQTADFEQLGRIEGPVVICPNSWHDWVQKVIQEYEIPEVEIE